jgi:hypothetical protein
MQNVSGVPNIDQAMIGTHYGFNVARGAKILMEKWNMAPEYRPQVGERDPKTIEDWYYAIWGYNGFAFSNHPLNPSYQLNRVAYSCGATNDGFGHDRTQYPYQELVLGCVQRPPTRAGAQLWAPQEVHMPDLNNPTWAEPLNVNNWNACSYSLNCAPMDFQTPNTWHQDATTLTVTREEVIGSPVMEVATDMEVHATSGGTTTTSFEVANSGSGVLAYRALSSDGWLQISPAAGVALGADLGGTPGRITVTVNGAGMGDGGYLGTVTLESLWGYDTPRVMTIHFFLGQDPTPEPTPTPPASSGVWGDADCTQAPPDPIDSLLTLRHDAGLSASTGTCPPLGTQLQIAYVYIWGDVDCSGSVDPVDSLKLLRFDAGLDVAQGPGCPAMSANIVFPA